MLPLPSPSAVNRNSFGIKDPDAFEGNEKEKQ